jgi:hypothetical protein
MIEAGGASTGVVMVAPQTLLRKAEGRKVKAALVPTVRRGQGHYRGRSPHSPDLVS